MGLMDELRRLARPYEDEDEEYDDELEEGYDEEETEEEEESTPRRPARRESRASRETRDSRPAREPARSYRDSRDSRESSRTYGYSYDGQARRPADKVVNINTTTQLQVVLVKPEKFENASDIADHLREKRTVVLNLESTNKDIARRLIDFLSGVAYAQEGKIKKVSAATFIITPYNVDIIGDLIDELENNGLYF